MSRQYRLISADSHVNEPPDLWTARVPAKFAERAPHMESFAEGDAWVLEGAEEPIPFGRNCCAGKPAELSMPWCRWDEAPESARSAAARAAEQDLDGVDAEVLFPTPRIYQSVAANTDGEFHLALVAAYNDWLKEYCAGARGRLFGAAFVPNRGVAEAVKEVERLADDPVIKTYLLGLYPHGSAELASEDDALWAAIAATGKPMSIHVSLYDTMPSSHKASGREGVTRITDALLRAEELIYGGVMRRFPDLNVAFVEVDAGWVPYFKEQADNRWSRLSRTLRAERNLPDPPSSYFDRFFFTYITDRYAIKNRHLIGVDHLMWSNDYPHGGSDWPHSWRTINSDFFDVDDAERQAILAGNAERLFSIG